MMVDVRTVLVSIITLTIACLTSAASAADARSAPRNTSAATQPSQRRTPAPQPVSFNDRYSVLAERNIFLRDRTVRPAVRNAGPSSQPAPRPLEESFTVVGIVEEDDLWRAYVEDATRSATIRLTAGDPVARGTVTRIEIDGIEYDQGGKRTWIFIGNNLTGKIGSGGSSDVASSANAGPTSLPFDPSDPNLSVEQRMRLRRMQGR